MILLQELNTTGDGEDQNSSFPIEKYMRLLYTFIYLFFWAGIHTNETKTQ